LGCPFSGFERDGHKDSIEKQQKKDAVADIPSGTN
jgi:hypothetical protein